MSGKEYKLILQEILETLDVTSIWLQQYHAHRGIVMIVGEYWADDANHLEQFSDLFSEYETPPEAVAAFAEAPASPREIQVGALAPHSHDYKEFAVHKVKTSLRCPIFYPGAEFWGYLELWESRQERHYTETERDQLYTLIEKLKPHLVDHFSA